MRAFARNDLKLTNEKSLITVMSEMATTTTTKTNAVRYKASGMIRRPMTTWMTTWMTITTTTSMKTTITRQAEEKTLKVSYTYWRNRKEV